MSGWDSILSFIPDDENESLKIIKDNLQQCSSSQAQKEVDAWVLKVKEDKNNNNNNNNKNNNNDAIWENQYIGCFGVFLKCNKIRNYTIFQSIPLLLDYITHIEGIYSNK